jgi:phospholipid/cholesterol/gamma-HCH transport system substrate-binding protein
MSVAIRKHLRDFIAIAVLVILALGVGYYIVQEQRLRIPILEEKPFELKAELESVNGVVAGQGQTIRVAGVRIGDVQSVEAENGVAVVTFAVDREFLPIYKDATLLLRPTTGLRDMFFQLDPGTRAAGEIEEGGTIPVSNTAPDVPLDEILAALDADTQAYLRILLDAAGQGLDGRGKDLGELLGSLGPINTQLRTLNRQVAKRQKNLANLVHNLNLLSAAVGKQDDDLASLVTASNATLGAIAEQDLNVQEAVSLLPGTLEQATSTFDEVSTFAAQLGPTVNALRPFAVNLPALNTSLATVASSSTPVLRNEIRPFVRAARDVVPDLGDAAEQLTEATPDLEVIGNKVNRLANMAAYNPGGAQPVGTPNRNEGYLYWAGWLGHNGNSVFSSGDGNGFYRRIYFSASCANILNIVSSTPLAPVVTGLGVLLEPGGVCSQ